MLTDIQKEQLKDRVYDLLGQVGMRVEHEKMKSDLLKMGCNTSPCGRIRFPKSVIDGFIRSQERTREEDQKREKFINNFGIVDWGQFLIWTNRWHEEEENLKKGVRTSVFDVGPTKYYDYPAAVARPVDTQIFIDMKKWAQTVPEIGYIATWYRQDVPWQIERIDSLALALRYSDKIGGVDAIYPEAVKYLKEISEIITGRPDA